MNISGQERLARHLATRELWLKICECVFALLLVLFAMIGNLLVCLAVYRNKRLRTIPNYYVISLACSDILMATVGMPLTFVTIVAGKWVLGSGLCQYQGFIGTVLGIASLLTITLTAANRYVKITHPSVYPKMFTKNNTLKSILCLWAVSLTAPVPYLATGHRYLYHPGKAMCFFDLDNSSPYYAVCSIFVFVVAPFCIICFCYYKVFHTVRHHNRQLQTSQVNTASTITQSSFSVNEIRLTKMLFAILLGFVICWCPFVIIDVVGVIRGQFSLDRWVYCVYTVSVGVASCVNPLIYAYMNADFRQEFKTMLKKIRYSHLREVFGRVRSRRRASATINGNGRTNEGFSSRQQCYVIRNNTSRTD